MPNKSKNRWLDVQIILASLAVTSTVALWNVFAKGSSPVASPTDVPTPDPTATMTATPYPTATPMATATANPNAVVQLPKVHILLGGNLPVVPVYAAVPAAPAGNSTNQVSAPKSSGGSKSAPPPAAKTSSSKP